MPTTQYGPAPPDTAQSLHCVAASVCSTVYGDVLRERRAYKRLGEQGITGRKPLSGKSHSSPRPQREYVEVKVRLDPETYRRIVEEAPKLYGRLRGSMSRFIRDAIRVYLAYLEYRRRTQSSAS